MAQPITYNTPPLAGRPPFATDEPDSVYDQSKPEQTRRLRQPLPPNPNDRSSAYDMYEGYIDEKEDPFTDDNSTNTNPFADSGQANSIPVAAPRPGYAAPVAALDLATPSPVATPDGRTPASPEMSEFDRGEMVSHSGSMPSTPHPLQPPMVPIAPVFARPSPTTSRDVKFEVKPIMRGETEDTVLPKRGQRGDDFWRRFSMVAKEDMAAPPGQKQSLWLTKTQSGSTRMSRWVWVVGLTLLIIIAGAIGLGWYVSHNSASSTAPTAIGGSAEEKALATDSEAAAHTSTSSTSHSGTTSLHVSPTNTVARRFADPAPTPLSPYPILDRSPGSHRIHILKTHKQHGRRSSPGSHRIHILKTHKQHGRRSSPVNRSSY